MKFKRIYLVLTMILYSIYGISQEFSFDKRAIYKLVYLLDSNNVKSSKVVDMELLINDKLSIFQSLQKRQKDSILYFHDKTEADKFSRVGGVILRPVDKFSYKIIKRNKGIQVYDSVFGIGIDGKDIIYSYEEDIDSLKWSVKSDTIRYAGFTCQRADLIFGGRKWIAWFASEIPISDGPYKFAGLPGLIIKIYDEKKTWNFDLFSFESFKTKHAINFQKWYVIQDKTKEDLYKDRFEFQQHMGVLLENSRPEDGDMDKYKSVKSGLQKMIKEDNNWIELFK